MRLRDVHKEDLVKKTAVELLVQTGFEGFSMNKLAKACNISVATLYIYYKDKDDLIIKIAQEEAERIAKNTLQDFDPNSSFEEGLKQQWINRSQSMLKNEYSYRLFEQLRSSTYKQKWGEVLINTFNPVLGPFMQKAISNGEIDELSFEVFWSLAYAPLYNLLSCHFEGTTYNGKPFKLTDEILWQTFKYVIKGLKN